MIAQAVTVVVALSLARPAALRRRDAGMLAASLRYSHRPRCRPPSPPLPCRPPTASSWSTTWDSAAVGRYSVANNVGSLLILLLGVLNVMWLPASSRLTKAACAGPCSPAAATRSIGCSCPAISVSAVGAPIVLRVWMPASYRPEGSSSSWR